MAKADLLRASQLPLETATNCDEKVAAAVIGLQAKLRLRLDDRTTFSELRRTATLAFLGTRYAKRLRRSALFARAVVLRTFAQEGRRKPQGRLSLLWA